MKHSILYLLALSGFLVSLNSVAHESPIDHVDRLVKVWLADDGLHLSYRMRISERQALLQLRAVDTDRDGKISSTESGTFFKSHGEKIAGYLTHVLSLRG